jgi:hypothetical protein
VTSYYQELQMTEVTDDEVLQALSHMNLEADNLAIFRAARHYLRHEVPLCCVYFYFSLEHFLPEFSIDTVERWLGYKGIRYELAMFAGMLSRYCHQCAEAAKETGIELNYTPCHSCLLARRFVSVPRVCPCCADRKAYPGEDK